MDNNEEQLEEQPEMLDESIPYEEPQEQNNQSNNDGLLSGRNAYQNTLGNKDYYKDRANKLNKQRNELKKNHEEAPKNLEDAKKRQADARQKQEEANKRKQDAKDNGDKAEKKDAKKEANAAKKEANAAKKEQKQIKNNERHYKQNLRNNKFNQMTNKINAAKAKGYRARHPLEAGKDAVKEKGKQLAKQGAKKVGELAKKGIQAIWKALPPDWKVVIIGVLAGIVMFFILFTVLLTVFAGDDDSAGNNNTSGYNVIVGGSYCTKINVDGKDYDLEEYVARVAYAELGTASGEALKAQAVLARTKALYDTKNSGICTMENSTNAQVMSEEEVIAEKAVEAAKATEGEVLTYNNSIIGSYFATWPTGTEGSQNWGEGGCGTINCSDGKCSTKFYKYPSKTEWTFTLPEQDSNGNYWNGSGLAAGEQEGHCHGVSQLGLLYYEQEGWTYDKMLNNFYDNDVKISKLTTEIEEGTSLIYKTGEFKNDLIFYDQSDYQSTPFCGLELLPNTLSYCGGNDNSICSSGCGTTSAAMAIASFKKDLTITPVKISNEVGKLGGCGDYGTAWQGIQDIVSQYGLYSKYLDKTKDNYESAINYLASGENLVIAVVTEGCFTGGGHYILLTGINDILRVHVLDPWGGDGSIPIRDCAREGLDAENTIRNGYWSQDLIYDNIGSGFVVISDKKIK